MTEAAEAPQRQKRTIAGRYELQELIGSGGMGRVYRAQDTRLKRTVAIKVLLGAGAEHNRRLVQEAQAQARVEHEHVCRIYEVGWDEEGEPFIVMQLIEGKTLGDLAVRMSFEQRAATMRAVAEAVHAGNRMGVIHRDLKPGNVLVEMPAEGGFRPFVTDFGLARDVTEVRSRSTGSVVGTPQYMAPEQARGETERIDRRTDVYGLGATLYETLCGATPFSGTSFEILDQVLRSDPVPLRRRDQAIPRDLAVICGKCMEKDPARRYDSARAVAEDLQRWLDGEPIQARAPGALLKVARWMRRHRTVATAVAAALVAASVVGVSLWRSRSKSRQLAELFGQDVKEIEGRMRFARVLPLHDTSAEERDVRERMARIETEMRPLGREGVGPGEYALGRGYLALGDPENARLHLQRAWDAGYHAPEAATGLGLSLAALYREQLQEANRLSDKTLREHRRRELEKLYRAPAKAALLAGVGATTEPAEYVEALIRFCDEDLEVSEKMARAALERAPWLYEARILLGQIHRERGSRKRLAADDAGANLELQAAADDLQIAVDFGRSDARAWDELCGLWVDEIALHFFHGGSMGDAPVQVLAACENAVRAAPGRAETHAHLASALRTWAEFLLRDGGDPRDTLERALTAARRALVLRPGDFEGNMEKGLALRLLGQHLVNLGQDGSAALDQAIEALQRALEARPENVQLYDKLARALADEAALLLDRGRDPTGSLERARRLLERASALDPEYLEPQATLGRVRAAQAAWQLEHGEDPGPALEAAVESFRAVAVASQAPLDATSAALAYVQKAEWEDLRGKDPAASIQWALGALKPALDAASPRPEAHAALGAAERVLALHLLRAGQDPRAECALARSALEAARRLAPERLAGVDSAVAVELIEARWLLAHDGDPWPSMDRGVGILQAGLSVNARFPLLQLRLGELRTLEGEALAHKGEDPMESFRAAQAALEAEGRAHPEGLALLEARAQLHSARAAWLVGQGAQTWLGGVAALEIQAGLDAAAKALSRRPGLPGALAAQTELTALKARLAQK